MFGKVLYTKNNPKGFSGKITCGNGKTYFFDNKSLVNGVFCAPNTEVEFNVWRFPDGKEKAINVRAVVKRNYIPFPSDKLEPLKKLVADAIADKPFYDCALLPALFQRESIDYKLYSRTLKEFIGTYLNDYIAQEKYVFNGTERPMVLLRKNIEKSDNQSQKKPQEDNSTDSNGRLSQTNNTNQGSDEGTSSSEGQTANNETLESPYQHLKKMFDNGEYETLLKSRAFKDSNPAQLGTDGVALALKAFAKCLDISTDKVELDDFQKALLSEPSVDGFRQYLNDERMMQLGAEASAEVLTIGEFRGVFMTLYNGKKTVNHNWKNVAERFWSARNKLAPYLTGLLVITYQNENGVDFYVDEAIKQGSMKELPQILHTYSTFVYGGQAGISERLQKKIVSDCLDCNDIKMLSDVCCYFDKEVNPNLTDAVDCITNNTPITWDKLFDWFTDGIGEQLAEKVVNYIWWRDSRNGITSDIVRVLSSVLWEYSSPYYTAVIFNNSYSGFTQDEKEKLLINNFSFICEEVKNHKKAFLLASYVYFNCIVPRDIHGSDLTWRETETYVKQQVEAALSETLSSAQAIKLLKYDPDICASMETYYCETFVTEKIKQVKTEDELDKLINDYEENGLSFVTQWIRENRKNVGISDKEQYFRSLLSTKKYTDAIQFAKNEQSFSNHTKISFVREAICKNFIALMLKDSAYQIFDQAIPIRAAETILLKNLVFRNSDAVMALIAIYARTEEWVKALYLFVPFRIVYKDIRSEFISNFNRFLRAHNISLEKLENHYDVLRAALKVFDSDEFDLFIEWARKVSIPNSRLYNPQPQKQKFDPIFDSMAKDGNYDLQWEQLVSSALRYDNNETQDYTRYSIIASYVGRNGIDAYNKHIAKLSTKSNNIKRYSDFYASLWKGLLSGSYGANFIKITRPLINIAPLTFWNLFYDISVCKNHVFTRTDFEFSKLNGLNHQTQQFYDELLERYNRTREVIFAKIALQILIESAEITNPRFELLMPYCSSNQSKDKILLALIQLTAQRRFLTKIMSLIDADCWRCNEAEMHVLQALHALCSNDLSYFLEDDCSFSAEEYESIGTDYLECLENYPEIRLSKSIYKRIQDNSKAYQYRLMQLLILSQTGTYPKSYLNKIVDTIPGILDEQSASLETLYYLNFMVTLYKRQLEIGSDDAGRLRNRYFRILTANLVLSEDRNAFSDDEIIALMQRNKHFTCVYTAYKVFKDALLELVSLPGLTERLFETFVIGFVSNNWERFVQDISEYDSEALALIRKIESSTNYRDLNIYFLKDFIYDNEPTSVNKIAKIEICSPLIASVMKEIRSIYESNAGEYAECKSFLIGICHLNDVGRDKLAYENLEKYLQFHNAELHKHWDLYMTALKATSYVKTIVNIFSRKIRQKRISPNTVKLWQPVFASFNEMSTYYYLLAVKNAAERNLQEAKNDYALIPFFDALPEDWNTEHLNLQAYLTGKATNFYPETGSNVAAYSSEKDATNVSFIQNIAQEAVDIEEEGKSVLEAAVEAFGLLAREELEEGKKYNCYQKLFNYVKKPEDLYNIYREAEGQNRSGNFSRITYNELVIGYGSLAIALDDQMTHDEKLDILIEIFDVYSFLNDINKGKQSIIDSLVAAEQIVLETAGVSFQRWISCQEKIRNILRMPFVNVDERDIEKWFIPVKQCTDIDRSSESDTALLNAFEHWRENWNLRSSASNIENAFIRSVDEKILALRAGPNLRIIINSSFIEDNSVFYQVINTSPTGNVSVSLNNRAEDAARLVVEIGVNGGDLERFEDAKFSNELILRPNDSCGQLYRLPGKTMSLIKQGDVVTIKLNIILNGKVICCNEPEDRKYTIAEYDPILTPSAVSDGDGYGIEVPAFTNRIKGFGREREKASLRRNLLKNNLAIIYGPSRAGKSSLLYYVGREYFKEYCESVGRTSVMQIRVANELDSRKNSYTQNMLNDWMPLQFETTEQIMEYLFCAPLTIAFSESRSILKGRMCTSGISSFPESAAADILTEIKKKGDVVGKYSIISNILSNYNCELWIMYDEFQQIVEQWIGSADELSELCTFIKYNQADNNIKLVFCGSDDLVRIFECVHDQNWNEFKAKTHDAWVFVGQLNENDFLSMMNDRAIWKNLPESIPWNATETQEGLGSRDLPAVLQSLYEYSGGNAICGKIFGKNLLEKVTNGYFANRRYFYPADITHVAYELLNAEASTLKNLLIVNATKNLDDERPYLLYMASILSADYNKADVSLDEILEFFASRSSEDVETALKVLIARGIIKSPMEPHRYTFTNLFYFDIYRDMATDGIIQKLRTDESITSKESDKIPWVEQVKEIVKEQPVVTRANIVDIIDSREDKDALWAEIKKFGDKKTEIHAQQYIEGGTGNNTNIEHQSIVQINAQTINTAFSTLFSDAQLSDRLEAFKKMPKPESFYLEEEKPRIKALQAIVKTNRDRLELGADTDDSIVVDVEEINAAENEIDEINSRAQGRYYGQIVSTMLQQADSTPSASLFADPSEEDLRLVLGIKESQIARLKELPSEYYRQLCFAVALHKMILPSEGETIDYKDVDFSPISIMYCKLVEIMLKERHLEIYGKALSNQRLQNGVSFGALIEKDNKKLLFENWKDITIGTFSWHIIISNVIVSSEGVSNRSSFSKIINEKPIDKTPNIERISKATGESKDAWKEHAMALAEVQEIRNSSAHGGIAISKTVFDYLMGVLFRENGGEIVRIWDLYQNSETNDE